VTESERQLAALAELTTARHTADGAWREAIARARRRGIPLRDIADAAGISPEHVRRLHRRYRPAAVDGPGGPRARRAGGA
jgi:hypothetical protein